MVTKNNTKINIMFGSYTNTDICSYFKDKTHDCERKKFLSKSMFLVNRTSTKKMVIYET